MSVPDDYPFPRYLSSKKTVDDRAINRHVWTALVKELAGFSRPRPVSVLEIGAGIGTMVERALDWGLTDRVQYSAIDAMAENIAEARRRFPQWATDHGFTVATGADWSFRVRKGQLDWSVAFEVADVFDFMDTHAETDSWDLLMANAFLDLVDIPETLPRLFELLTPTGLCYFSINFDGATIFQPGLDAELDDLIESLYHETMDERIINGKRSGDSRTGRHMFDHLRKAGADLIAAGSSDWVVFSGPNGYPGDEEFFLHFLVNTVGMALKGDPRLRGRGFSRWVEQRHRQVESGDLVYIAHQLDVLGRKRKQRNP